jgi:hypothetical protein
MRTIDAEAPRERIFGRPATSGDEVDAFARDRRMVTFRPGERPGIKARHNRAVRTSVRVQLARYTTV